MSKQIRCAITWGAVRTQHHFCAIPATDAYMESNHSWTSDTFTHLKKKNWSIIFKKAVNGKKTEELLKIEEPWQKNRIHDSKWNSSLH